MGTSQDTVLSFQTFIAPSQRFSTSVPQACLKHATPDYLVRGTDLSSLRLWNKKITTANTTIASSVNESKLYLYFFARSAKYTFSGVPHSLNSECVVPWEEKGWSSLLCHLAVPCEMLWGLSDASCPNSLLTSDSLKISKRVIKAKYSFKYHPFIIVFRYCELKIHSLLRCHSHKKKYNRLLMRLPL